MHDKESECARGSGEVMEKAGGEGIVLVTFGEMDRESLSFLPSVLGKILGLEVRWGPALPLPLRSYRARRRRYLSAPFLTAVASLPAESSRRLLGLTDVDLFTPGLNFIFGQAAMGGRYCLVSTARLNPRFYGEPEDQALFRERVVKEAVHELGHTFGLEHCGEEGCVMCFSNSIADTDRKGKDLCPNCRRRYIALLEQL